MKKKILSFLLCLCMVAVLLPTTALADETPGSYGYAYDVQREPDFPSTADKKITLKGLDYPIMSNGSRGDRNDGLWTLTRVGTYSHVTDNVDNNVINNVNVGSLGYIVGKVAGAYRDISDKNTIVIHELKKDGGHIAYGVVLAYSETETENMAVFIGDSLGSDRGGAGYLLSTTPQTGSVNVTAGMIATDFVEQTASIVLAPDTNQTFPAVPEGYGEQTPLTVTVTKTGTVATGSLNITLSGNNAACFTVTPGTIGNIGEDSNVASFQVKPKTGLAEGTYTATVTVRGNNVDPRSINVSFTVTASQSTPVVIIVPDDTTNTADPAKNPETGDNSTHLLWAVMASSALCAAALLFSSRRRGEEMQ